MAELTMREVAIRKLVDKWVGDAGLLAAQADRIDDARAAGEAAVFRACADEVLAVLQPGPGVFWRNYHQDRYRMAGLMVVVARLAGLVVKAQHDVRRHSLIAAELGHQVLDLRAQLAAQQGIVDAALAWRPAPARQTQPARSSLGRAVDAYRAAQTGSVEADTPAGPERGAVDVVSAVIWRIHGPLSTDEDGAWMDAEEIVKALTERGYLREVAGTPAAEPAETLPPREPGDLRPAVERALKMLEGSVLAREVLRLRDVADSLRTDLRRERAAAELAHATVDRLTSAPAAEPAPDDVRARRYTVRFDDLFHVPPSWLSWRCDLGGSRVDPGYVDGACRYDHNVKSWSQLAAEADEHLARWHPHICALAGTGAPTEREA